MIREDTRLTLLGLFSQLRILTIFEVELTFHWIVKNYSIFPCSKKTSNQLQTNTIVIEA